MLKTGATVDFKRKIVTISADFRERASVVGSEEYLKFQQMEKDHEGFVFKYAPKIRADKETHKGLTVKAMIAHVSFQDDRDTLMQEYNDIKIEFYGTAKYYGKVKSWFLNRFTEYKAEVKGEKNMLAFLEKLEAEKKVDADRLKKIYVLPVSKVNTETKKFEVSSFEQNEKQASNQ